MTKTTIRAAIAVAALVLGATACGGDDTADGTTDTVAEAGAASDTAAAGDTAGDDTADDASAATTVADGGDAGGDGSLASAIADDMWASSEGGDGPLASRDEAQCWADGVVDGIGEGRLNELGVTPANVGDIEDLDLTEDEVSTVVESLFDCADVQKAFVEQFTADLGTEAAQCVADKMDEDLVKQLLTSSFGAGESSGAPEEFITIMGQIATDCGLQG